jgi:hypothetical protein
MNTTDWTTDELRRIGGSTELRLASYRPDGTLRLYVTMWTGSAGDGIYVRSAYGADNPWYRRAHVVSAPHRRRPPRLTPNNRNDRGAGLHESDAPVSSRPSGHAFGSSRP